MEQANVLNRQVKLLLWGKQTCEPLPRGNAELLSRNPTFLGGSKNCDESESSNRRHPPNHFRAEPYGGSGF